MGVAAATWKLDANPLGMPLGYQPWTLRESLGKDFEGTLRKIAAGGFQMIEMVSPPGYADWGYGPLVKMKASEMRRMIHAVGLGCESCMYAFQELKDNLDDRIAYAKELGVKAMIVATIPLWRRGATNPPWLRRGVTMAEWLQAADEMNKLGEQTHKAGIQLGYHNHNIEFEKIDGVLIYDALMKQLDPELVKMEFQVLTIQNGYDPVTYLMKYPGRFISLHLYDWSTTEKRIVPIGTGSIDWKKLFAAAKTGGIKRYFVELEWDLALASVPYLRKLEV
jgi:sugar phosphate isomerase/epimerase